jgi:hypothetical protein
MKTISKLIFSSLAMGGLLWSCTADKVAPKSDSPSIGKICENHSMLRGGCSDTIPMKLVSTTGSDKVNFGCGSNCPEWGSVYVVNNADSIGIYVTMATGWLIDAAKSSLDVPGTFSFVPSGAPNLASNFSYNDVSPMMNKWELYRDKASLNMDPSNCFSLALNLTVCRASFMGNVIPASVRHLWAVNTLWNDPNSQYSSTSPYLLNWCWASCPKAWPEATRECKIAYKGLPEQNGCATLGPKVEGAVGAVSYEWDNGSTASTLTVCPGSTTTYRVSVSDENGPFSVTDFDVNVIDAQCTIDRSTQPTVKVCHIPPGNPSVQQELCLEWDEVPVHVAQFRAHNDLGQPIVPAHGHNSGCKIGPCMDSPCL